MTKISQLPTASSVDIGDASKLPLNSVNDFQTKGVTLEQLKSNYFCDIYCASLTIASADVLTLNATPLTIVPAVAGKKIEVISASVDIDFNTAAYATNTTISLICAGASATQYRINACLAANTTSHRVGEQSTASLASDTQLIANADLNVYVGGGNPTSGDSDITVYVLYRLI